MVTRALAQDVTSLAGQVSSTIAALGTVNSSVQALTPRVATAERNITGLQQLANATAAEVVRLDSTLGCRTAPAAVAFGSVAVCSVFFPNGQRCAPVCTQRACHAMMSLLSLICVLLLQVCNAGFILSGNLTCVAGKWQFSCPCPPPLSLPLCSRITCFLSTGTWFGSPVCIAVGTSIAAPAPSCAAMKVANSAIASGIYWLQLPGVNGNAPFQIFCDFAMDGGVSKCERVF
jgi:hypothetical protein